MTLSDNIADYCFIDCETRALPDATGPEGDVTQSGVDVYSRNAFANIWAYAIGDAPTRLMSLDETFDERLTWDVDTCDALKAFHKRAEARTAWYVAWNMGFDRTMWNGPESDFPHMRIDMSLDAMVQAGAAGLPGKLEHAGLKCGFGGKDTGGSLMSMFAPAGGLQPTDRPELWQQYCAYGVRDVELLRQIWRATISLTREEWHDYWVSERINARGMPLDTEYARRAAAVAEANIDRINARLPQLTSGVVTKITQAARITNWVYDRLSTAEARDLLVKSWDLDDEDDLQPAKLSLDKARNEALTAYFNNLPQPLSPADATTLEVLDLRLYGGSSSPAKFAKMGLMQHGGILRNQFVFNGAPQTGRYSSKGVQIHNLLRKSLGEKEAAYMELINDLAVA